MADKVTLMSLKVDLQCPQCKTKVKKILSKCPEVSDQVYDEEQDLVKIKVICCNPEKIRDKLCCKGRKVIKSIEIVEPAPPPPPPPPPPLEKTLPPPPPPPKPKKMRIPTQPSPPTETKVPKKAEKKERSGTKKVVTEPARSSDKAKNYPQNPKQMNQSSNLSLYPPPTLWLNFRITTATYFVSSVPFS